MSWLSTGLKDWKKYPLLGIGGASLYGAYKRGMPQTPQIDTSYIQRLLGEQPDYGMLENIAKTGYPDTEYQGAERRMRSRGIERGYTSGMGDIRTSLAGRGMGGGPAEAALIARLSQQRGISMEDLDTTMAGETKSRQDQAIAQLLGLQTQQWGQKAGLLGQESQAQYQNALQEYYKKMMPYKTLGDIAGTGLGAWAGGGFK